MRQLGILAKEKLNGKLIHNPHRKQENLHLLIFSKLDNDIFMSLMETYWKIYEGVGLALFNDFYYIDRVRLP